MRKNYVVLAAGVAVVLSLASCRNRTVDDGPRACFEHNCVALEIAATPQERARGLQEREHLSDGEGMLFVFERAGRHSFWMKDTLISLDIIWLDAARRVVDVKIRVPPCADDPCPNYTPQGEARYVLEVRGGLSEQWGLGKGDRVEIIMDQGL